MKIDGGCYCGQIRYTFEGEVSAAMQCHCRECQYITGGNPNVFVILPEAGFSYTQGEPGSFKRPDLEEGVTRYFCPNCGTAIGTKSPRAAGAMVIKVGTMDDPSFYKPSVAIFTKDSQSFHHVGDGIPSFEDLPG
jgi:hypothetical protein